MDPKPSPLDNWILNPPLLITESQTFPLGEEVLGSSYQEGRVWDLLIKRGGFKIQLSRGEG
jgi:hypothetical protein